MMISTVLFQFSHLTFISLPVPVWLDYYPLVMLRWDPDGQRWTADSELPLFICTVKLLLRQDNVLYCSIISQVRLAFGHDRSDNLQDRNTERIYRIQTSRFSLVPVRRHFSKCINWIRLSQGTDLKIRKSAKVLALDYWISCAFSETLCGCHVYSLSLISDIYRCGFWSAVHCSLKTNATFVTAAMGLSWPACNICWHLLIGSIFDPKCSSLVSPQLTQNVLKSVK